MRFETESRRLRLAGDIEALDLVVLRDRIEAFCAGAALHVMIDLTAVTDLEPEAARYLVEAKAELEAEGRRMTLLRKLGSPADLALLKAAAEG